MRKVKIIIIAATAWLSGCANMSTDILFGKRISSDHFEGRDPTFTLRTAWEPTPTVQLGYEHISFVRNGKPFNDLKEDTVDQIILTLLFDTDSPYNPNLNGSFGFKYKTDGFEGNDMTIGIRVNQPIYYWSNTKIYCEYYYLNSSLMFNNNDADMLQLISCGVSIND